MQAYKSTPGITSIVVSQSTKTDGAINTRVCLDPRNQNKATRQPYYYQTIVDIIPKLAGVQYITVIDMKTGNWQVHP